MSVEFEGREVKPGDRIKAIYAPFGESDWLEVVQGPSGLCADGRWLLDTLTITAHKPKPEPVTVTITLPPGQKGLDRSSRWSDQTVLRAAYRWVFEAHKRGLL